MLTEKEIMMIVEGIGGTLWMVLASVFFGYLIGLPMGIALTVTGRDGIRPNAAVYKVLDVISNIFRSIPFLILLILVQPFTRFLLGKSYGATATIVPLTIAAGPYIARMVESSLKEVDRGGAEHGREHLDDYFQGAADRGAHFADRQRYHRHKYDPGILRDGGRLRRRRTWRHCRPLRLQPLETEHPSYHSCAPGRAGAGIPDGRNVHFESSRPQTGGMSSKGQRVCEGRHSIGLGRNINLRTLRK